MNYPIVYDKFETNFDGYGLAILENAKDDICIRERLNGEFSLSFALPATDPKWQYIQEDGFVKVDGQLFIIREIETSREGLSKWGFVKAEHVFFTLLEEYIEDRRAVDCSAYVALDTALDGTPFTVGIVEPGTTSTAYFVQTNPVAAINTVIERWGGELRPNNWKVDLLNRRGADRGVQFRYRKNLKGIKRVVDTRGVITRLYVYGRDGLTIESVNGGKKYIDSPNISLWRRPKCHEVKSDIEDPAELFAYGQAYLAKHDTPFVSYEVSIVELKALAEYGNLEHFELGDDVRAIDDDLSIDIKARIVDYDRYKRRDGTIDPTRSKVVLANFRPGIEDEIGKLQDTRVIVERAFSREGKLSTFWLEGIINVLQNRINSATSNWYTDDNGNLIFEALDGSSAMKLAGAGFAIANQKDGQGNWIWRTFGTGEGFTADLMNAGKVKAELIQIGAGTDFAVGYNPSEKETPEGAQAKATAAQAAAVQAAVDAEAASKVYAEAQAAAAVQAAAVYADGVVTAEEQARIDQANANLAAAQAYAETKASEAQAAATAVASAAQDVAEQAALDAETAYNAANTAQTTASNAQQSVTDHNNSQSPHNLPSYVLLTSEGVKVFDNLNQLRVFLGQYAAGKFGIQVIEGEIYASSFSTAQPANKSGCIDITKAGEFKAIGPKGNTTVYISGAYNDQGRIRLYDDGVPKAIFYINGGDTDDLIIDNSGGDGVTIETGTGEYIKMGAYWGVTEARGLRLSGISEDLLPYWNDSVWLGRSDRKWGTVYARYVQTGDLCFSEKECAVCGKPFAQGDKLILLVNAIDDESTYTIPVHEGCKDKPATITIEVPEKEEYFFVGEDGEPQKGKRWKKEVSYCEHYQLKKEYYLDEKTGDFKKKAMVVKVAKDDACARLTPNGVRYYHGSPRQEVELNDILEDVEVFPEKLATKETATWMEKIKKRKPVMKKVTISVGNPPN